MITQEMLDRLRAERATPRARMDYTIGGTVEARVNTALEAEREQKIARGEAQLRQALENFRREQSVAAHKNLAKAKFNHHQQKEITP